MTVLVVSAWFNPSNVNEGIFIHEFCEALQRNGVHVVLLSVKIFSIRQAFSCFRSTNISFPHNYRIEYVKCLKIASTGTMRERVLRKVLRRLSTQKIECVHTQSVCNNITPYIAHQIAKHKLCKHIITEHYTSFEESGGRFFSPYLDKQQVEEIVKSAYKRVAVSRYAASLFESYFGADYITIPNILSKVYFDAAFVKLPRSEKITFCFIGGLEKRKGILELLSAFQQLQLPNIHLNIIGNGSLLNKVVSFIECHKLTRQINFLGLNSPDQIVEVLDASHALISASDMETFGLVIAEAHLRGRPVIATNVGAVGELIDGENGILFSSKNKTEELKSAIRKFILSMESFDQYAIREKALNRFNESKVVGAYENLYTQ